MKRLILPAILAIGLVIPSIGVAHPPTKGKPGAHPHGGPIHQRIKKLRADILRYDVGLNPAKAAKVTKIMDGFDPIRRKLHQRKQGAKRALRRLLRSDSNDQKAFKRVLDDLLKVQDDLSALRRKQRIALRKELTPKQQAKLFVALKQLQRRIRRVKRQLKGRRGGRHMRGPGSGMRRGPRMRFRGPRGPRGPRGRAPHHPQHDEGDDESLF